MEEKILETQSVEAPVQPTPSFKPTEGKQWSKIVLFSIFGLLLVGGLVLAGYKLERTSQEVEKKDSKLEQREVNQCNQDSDCVLAVRLDKCCSCPQAALRTEIVKDENLVEYEFGKDYSKEKKVDCQDVVCVPCVFWNKAICEAGKCKAIFEKPEAEKKEIRISDSDNGEKVMIEVGQTLVLSLGSNHSTGYSWKIAEINETLLEQIFHEYKPSQPIRLGSGGEEIWHFRTEAKGETILALNYQRQWEKVEQSMNFKVEVTIR